MTQEVVGSSPTWHPKWSFGVVGLSRRSEEPEAGVRIPEAPQPDFGKESTSLSEWWLDRKEIKQIRRRFAKRTAQFAPLVQLNRMSGYEPGGRGFESLTEYNNMGLW